MKTTKHQRLAMVSLEALGMLDRDSAHDDFIGLQGSRHHGRTIKSMIDRGYARAISINWYGYPMKVVKTAKLTDFFTSNRLPE